MDSAGENFPRCLDAADFCGLFGIERETLSASCRAMIAEYDFRYRILTGAERDDVLLRILKRVDERRVAVAGAHRLAQWEKGWGENLKEFGQSGDDLAALIPKYIRPGFPLRLNKEFVATADPNFELNWYKVFRHWLAHEYLSDASSIYEFGCGSGYNVAYLAEQFPRSRIVGLDWAQPSVDIVEALKTRKGMNVEGRLFNFFEPDHTLDVPRKSAFLTIGALEQTGEAFHSFLEFAIEKQPDICVHVEPVMEFYDLDNIVDYTAFRCLSERKFVKGFCAALEGLARDGRAEIIKTKRSFFGSLMLESYAQVIWRPLPGKKS
jgi:SAM-dependent methyltransferase